MCVYSMICDHFYEKWQPYIHPPTAPLPQPLVPLPPQTPNNPWPQVIPVPTVPPVGPTQDEVDEFRRLLERAREYDKRHGEPDCELEEKRERLKKLAEELGVKIDFV